MKFKQQDVVRATHKIPEIRYEDPNETSLTSFSGLVIFQSLFQRLQIRQELQRCFGHLRCSAVYPTAVVVLWLITHLLLGFRKLRITMRKIRWCSACWDFVDCRTSRRSAGA